MVRIFLIFGYLFYHDNVVSLKFWIIFRMSALEKIKLDKNLSVLSKSLDGKLLPLSITVTV